MPRPDRAVRRKACRAYLEGVTSLSVLPGAARGATREDALESARALLGEVVKKRGPRIRKPLSPAHRAQMLIDAGALRRLARTRPRRIESSAFLTDMALGSHYLKQTADSLLSVSDLYRMHLRDALEELGQQSSSTLVPGATVRLAQMTALVCTCHRLEPGEKHAEGDVVTLVQIKTGSRVAIEWRAEPDALPLPTLPYHTPAPKERTAALRRAA